MYCRVCGAKLKEGALFCSECGAEVEGVQEVVEQPKSSPKVWDIFSKVGFIGGLVCFILSFIPFIDLVACEVAICFIVLSALGKKSYNPDSYARASKGLGFSIAAAIIGFISYIFYMVILFS